MRETLSVFPPRSYGDSKNMVQLKMFEIPPFGNFLVSMNLNAMVYRVYC